MGWPEWINLNSVLRGVKWFASLVGFSLIIKGLYWFLKKIQLALIFRHGNIPRKTIVIAKPRVAMWCEARVGETPAMQVMSECLVTNISDHDIRLVDGYLKHPKTRATDVSFMPSRHIPISGDTYISPRCPVATRMSFFVQPSFKKKGESFQSEFCIVDQYLNEHWHPKIEITSLP